MKARFFVLLPVLFLLLPIAPATFPVWGHDQNAAQKVQGAERREVQIPIKDFTLTDQAGRPFRFQSLRGKVAIVAFAYTTCPDVCPLITAAMRQVQDGLQGEERRRTFLLTVTTDPEIDTPAVLAAYARRYGVELGTWAFLTGEPASLSKVWQNFGVGVKRLARGLIDHTSLTAVIDPSGAMRVAYVGSSPDAKMILRDVRGLLHGR